MADKIEAQPLHALPMPGTMPVSGSPALPAVDGGEVLSRLNEIASYEAMFWYGQEHVQSALVDAKDLIATQQQQITALMNERTSLIETKREQLAQMQVDTTRAEWRAVNAESRVQSLEDEVKVLREAVERSNTALNDWLNVYAEELCDPDRVAEAHARIGAGGTIAYIAEITAQNRAALKEHGQ